MKWLRAVMRADRIEEQNEPISLPALPSQNVVDNDKNDDADQSQTIEGQYADDIQSQVEDLIQPCKGCNDEKHRGAHEQKKAPT